jgi:hypothetical protein
MTIYDYFILFHLFHLRNSTIFYLYLPMRTLTLKYPELMPLNLVLAQCPGALLLYRAQVSDKNTQLPVRRQRTVFLACGVFRRGFDN